MLVATQKKPSQRPNFHSGIATIEMIPILVLFVILFNYALGFFGVIHSGIINSIAARNYAFETFRNRADLTYLRDTFRDGQERTVNYKRDNFRFHGIIQEDLGNVREWFATQRPIKFTDVNDGIPQPLGEVGDRFLVRELDDRSPVSNIFTGRTPDEGRSGVNPVWIQTLYGICLNSRCRRD
jgi:hypothetical protein